MVLHQIIRLMVTPQRPEPQRNLDFLQISSRLPEAACLYNTFSQSPLCHPT